MTPPGKVTCLSRRELGAVGSGSQEGMAILDTPARTLQLYDSEWV
jgi:hypothetical protein